jgi:hypothetical protein
LTDTVSEAGAAAEVNVETDGMMPASQCSTDTPLASLASSDSVVARLWKSGRSVGLRAPGNQERSARGNRRRQFTPGEQW